MPSIFPVSRRRIGRLESLLAATYALGALVHVYFTLVSPDVYESFADLALVDVVREAWTALVVPRLAVLLPAVILFEAGLAVAFALGGRPARVAHAVAAGFQVALAPLGPWAPINLLLAGLHGYLFRSAAPSRIAASPDSRETEAS